MLAKAAALSKQNAIAKEEEKEVVSKTPSWLEQLIKKKDSTTKKSPFSVPRRKESEDASSSAGVETSGKQGLPSWMQKEVSEHEKRAETDDSSGVIIIRERLVTGSGDLISKQSTRKAEETKEEPSWLKELNKRKMQREARPVDVKPEKPVTDSQETAKQRFDYRSYSKPKEKTKMESDESDGKSVNVSELMKRLSKKSSANQTSRDAGANTLHKDEVIEMGVTEQTRDLDIHMTDNIAQGESAKKMGSLQRGDKASASESKDVDDISLTGKTGSRHPIDLDIDSVSRQPVGEAREEKARMGVIEVHSSGILGNKWSSPEKKDAAELSMKPEEDKIVAEKLLTGTASESNADLVGSKTTNLLCNVDETLTKAVLKESRDVDKHLGDDIRKPANQTGTVKT